MNTEIIQIITDSESAALATTGPHGLNVVPISVFEPRQGEVHLFDFFMNKTAENIQAEGDATFTCWKGFSGLQVKAEAKYETYGPDYDAAVVEMKERFPDRTLKALIRLIPSEIYDVTPRAISDNKL